MAILFWTGVIVCAGIIAWLTWKLAKKIDHQERLERKWSEYISYLEQEDQEQADYYKWLMEMEDDE